MACDGMLLCSQGKGIRHLARRSPVWWTPAFDWDDDRPPRTPWHETLVYEMHVKGFTKQHPDVPENLRGTYAGLASPAAIEYLRELGVTAVELLPVHYHIDEHFLFERGRVNYWGYNTLGFFAPDPRYAATGPDGAVREFQAMVRGLHAAGIEVILDVVYNHTAEGNELGPHPLASRHRQCRLLPARRETAPATSISPAAAIR